MNQTAVEWLVSQLNKPGFAEVVTDEEIRQAKEMEKEQMCEFADEFAIECINFHHEKTMSTERFFELTYGDNKTFNTKER